MRHVRMLGLSLVAVLALAAIGSSSAGAAPQWVKCENVGSGGLYANSDCTVKAKPKGTGAFTLLNAKQVGEKRVAEGKSKNVPFSGESIGNGGVLSGGLRECELPAESGKFARVTRAKCAEGGGREANFEELSLRIECEHETNTGETAPTNKVANVHVAFTGCSLFGSVPCGNVSENEVDTNTLKGSLGYINKAAKEVGLVLEPQKKGGAFAEFVCGGFAGTVVGAGNAKTGAFYQEANGEEKHGGYDQIISPITPVNKMSSQFTQVYTIEPEYPFGNLPKKFEGKHISQLENYLIIEESGEQSQWAPAGEEITNTNTSEEEGEIKA